LILTTISISIASKDIKEFLLSCIFSDLLCCGGLTLASWQTSSHLLSHSLSSTGWGRKQDEYVLGCDKHREFTYLLSSLVKETHLGGKRIN